MGWEPAVAAFVLVAFAVGALGAVCTREDRRLGQQERHLLYRERRAEIRASVQRAAYQPQYPMLHTLNTPYTEIERKSLPASGVADVPLPPLPLVVPSTRALLDQGIIAIGRPLVQGWAAGGPLLGSPEQTFTAAIGGKSRSGKTRTMALIIGQMVLHGARLLVIDPHRHKADALTKLIAPLLPWCLVPPAFSLDEIKAVIERGEAEMTARRNGQHLDEPLLLVIDEYTLVQRAGAHVEWGPRQTLASRAAALVESVATEGGGMGMKGLIGGQNWKGTRAGGTEVRQMLQSAWVHRSWAEQARYLVPDADLADQAESLVPGRAIFVPSDDDPILVGMPLTELADLERMAAMRVATETATNGYNNGYPVATDNVIDITPRVAKSVPGVADVAISAEARRALALFLAGKSMAEVVWELRGIKSSEGGKYQIALTDCTNLVRQAMKAKGA